MPLIIFGINHNSGPTAIRERLAFTTENTIEALNHLTQTAAIDEAVILSTCNRTEVYAITATQNDIHRWITAHRKITDIDITPYCYHHEGIKAVRHLMRVASGLDSMVVGESQILAQIKKALTLAHQAGMVGKELQPLFPAAFSTSKHIRHATDIGRCPVSIAYAAVSLCKEFFSSLTNCTVLLVGAGTTISLVATHLTENNCAALYIANRHLDKAESLATKFDGTALTLDQIPSILPQVNIIITATGSAHPIVHASLFESNRQHPLFIADLAMPRDVDPAVGTLDNIHLYNIDDLRDVISNNVKNRQKKAKQAESMIDLYAANYMRELRIDEASDIIRHYRSTMITQRDRELEKALLELKAGKNPEAVLKNFGRNFVNKVMHNPTVKLREAASEGRLRFLAFAKELFS